MWTAYEYYIESLAKPRGFMGYPCPDKDSFWCKLTFNESFDWTCYIRSAYYYHCCGCCCAYCCCGYCLFQDHSIQETPFWKLKEQLATTSFCAYRLLRMNHFVSAARFPWFNRTGLQPARSSHPGPLLCTILHLGTVIARSYPACSGPFCYPCSVSLVEHKQGENSYSNARNVAKFFIQQQSSFFCLLFFSLLSSVFIVFVCSHVLADCYCSPPGRWFSWSVTLLGLLSHGFGDFSVAYFWRFPSFFRLFHNL